MNISSISKQVQAITLSSEMNNVFLKVMSFLKRNEPIIYPLGLWSFILILTLIIHITCLNILGEFSPNGDGFSSWDAQQFLRIVENGYLALPSTAFFPLLPLLIWILHHLTGFSYSLSGCVISNTAYLGALIFFYKLLIANQDKELSRKTLWLLTMFPTAFFFNVVYSESLTLLSTVLFFYFLNEDKWYRAMISGSFAPAAHTLGGILFLVGLCYLMRKRRELSPKIFWQRFFGLSIVGFQLLLYMGYLQIRFGNAFSFFVAETFWNRIPVIPMLNVFLFLYDRLMHSFWIMSDGIFVNYINGMSVLIMVTIGVIMILSYHKSKLVTFELKVFFLLTLLASITSGAFGGSITSYGRFMLVLFPGFMVWADKFRNQTMFLIVLAIMIALKTILLGLFISGFYVL